MAIRSIVEAKVLIGKLWIPQELVGQTSKKQVGRARRDAVIVDVHHNGHRIVADTVGIDDVKCPLDKDDFAGLDGFGRKKAPTFALRGGNTRVGSERSMIEAGVSVLGLGLVGRIDSLGHSSKCFIGVAMLLLVETLLGLFEAVDNLWRLLVGTLLLVKIESSLKKIFCA